MIEIRGDDRFFTVTNTTEWDAYMNNSCGGNKLVIGIIPAPELTQMYDDIKTLQMQVRSMNQERDMETILQNSNPAVKDAYEKYQTIYKLVRQSMDTLKGDEDC